MNLKIKFTIICLIYMLAQASGMPLTGKTDSLLVTLQGVIDTDSILENSIKHTNRPANKISTVQSGSIQSPIGKTKTHSMENISRIQRNELIRFDRQAFDSLISTKAPVQRKTEYISDLKQNMIPVRIDTSVLKGNPFFIDLVYTGIPLNFEWNLCSDFNTISNGRKATNLTENTYEPIKIASPEDFILKIRSNAKSEISRSATHLYKFRVDELPDPNQNKNQFINEKKLVKVQFTESELNYNERKRLIIAKTLLNPWFHESSAMLQFSENFISQNWHQGGNSNVAVLGIMMGKLNYDNRENIQWDNNAEWRVGFNSVSGDTLRVLSTNNDMLRINSKLGIKASGNWFYSGSVDFSTQLFNSYKGINSTEMKTSFLTPVRVNIGVGLDYKYKKIFSIMFSPVSYKYIYLNEKNPLRINPNLFGIKKGEHILSELGSSFKALFSFAPAREIQLDSKLLFYTNYQRVEIDWELVCNFTINRFMSTRISFNPRYDNTVIEKNGDRAGIQFKQLLSVGFSHKFR